MVLFKCHGLQLETNYNAKCFYCDKANLEKFVIRDDELRSAERTLQEEWYLDTRLICYDT